LLAALSSYEERLTGAFNEGLETGRLLPLPRQLHQKASEVGANLKKFQRIFVSTLPLSMDEEAGSTSAMAPIHFDCQPIDRFGNQLGLLAEKLKGWRKDGYHVLICTEQPQRILGILKEWDCPAAYVSSEGADDEETHIQLSDDSQTQAKDKLPGGDLLANTLSQLEGGKLEAPKKEKDRIWVCRHGFTHGYKLNDAGLICITDAEMFGVKRKPTVYRRPVIEKNYERFTSVADLKVSDYVVHTKHGIGQFIGVQRISMDSQQREYLTVQYSGEDRLYVPVDQINLLSRYRGAGDSAPRLSRLGGAEWESTKRRVKKSIKQVAEDLVNLYAMRAKQEGYQCPPDTPWQFEMEEAFPYEETPDQWQAIQDVINPNPDTAAVILRNLRAMSRNVVVDLGSGLTRMNVRLIKDFDQLILVVEPHRVVLNMARELLKELEAMGVGRGKTNVIMVNRAQSTLQVPWQEAEQILGHEMLAIISPAPELAFQATEAGYPIVLFQPTSIVATQINKLTEEVEARVRSLASGISS